MLCPPLFLSRWALTEWDREVNAPRGECVVSVSCHFLQSCWGFFLLWKLTSYLILIMNCTLCHDKVLFLRLTSCCYCTALFPLELPGRPLPILTHTISPGFTVTLSEMYLSSKFTRNDTSIILLLFIVYLRLHLHNEKSIILPPPLTHCGLCFLDCSCLFHFYIV